MRHFLIAGVLLLASTVDSSAQDQALDIPSAPINVTFVETPLEDAITYIARFAGVTIEFDATVTEEMRRAQLAQRIRLVNSTVEGALAALTSMNGLSYTVIGPKAVRISTKP